MDKEAGSRLRHGSGPELCAVAGSVDADDVWCVGCVRVPVPTDLGLGGGHRSLSCVTEGRVVGVDDQGGVLGRSQTGLGCTVVCSVASSQEGWHADGEQDANDEDNNHDLNEGEATFGVLG